MKKRIFIICIMLLVVVGIYFFQPFNVSGVIAGAILASMLFYITGEMVLSKASKY